MKYVIYKDYLAGKHHIGYEYITAQAKTDFEAVEEAEKEWDAEKLYLIRIMKKEGKAVKVAGDTWKKQLYKAVMCKRSDKVGWHANGEKHAENDHSIYRFYKKDLEFFEIRS